MYVMCRVLLSMAWREEEERGGPVRGEPEGMEVARFDCVIIHTCILCSIDMVEVSGGVCWMEGESMGWADGPGLPCSLGEFSSLRV